MPASCHLPPCAELCTEVRSRRHPVGWRSSIRCADEPTNERSAPCLADADCPAIDPDIPIVGSEESTPSRGECFWSGVLFEDVRLELLGAYLSGRCPRDTAPTSQPLIHSNFAWWAIPSTWLDPRTMANPTTGSPFYHASHVSRPTSDHYLMSRISSPPFSSYLTLVP
ncbi:uncharacterized protein CLUP02_12560 [Colletotrichum lupini]|uniref:Uncharacterized protein n=1 Tax=Colletotrichum lupini TaxID=145971 RepID=A0A9Q8T0Q2_9PEZI|nr:uncharacterized protein CLUP02_12560 [Colletotrichum lupini]UQC87058.1 hypothetical protein CLUP02_12560 [Colletotrichum lupini]